MRRPISSRGTPDILGAERDVVLHDGGDRLVVGVLKDHARALADVERLFGVSGVQPEHGDFPLSGAQKGVDELGERGFAAAVPAEHGDELPLRNGEGDAVDGKFAALLLVVRIFYVFKTNGGEGRRGRLRPVLRKAFRGRVCKLFGLHRNIL